MVQVSHTSQIHMIRHVLLKIWYGGNVMKAFQCTTKGSHEGSGGKVANFFVAIAYNKGVVYANSTQEM